MIPLDSSGYGALLRGILKGAAKVYEFVKSIRVPGYKIQPLAEPDTNIVCFIVNRRSEPLAQNHERTQLEDLSPFLVP